MRTNCQYKDWQFFGLIMYGCLCGHRRLILFEQLSFDTTLQRLLGLDGPIDENTLAYRLKKISSRHAGSNELVIEQCLARVPKAFIKTVTAVTFANHQSLARTFDADMYVIRPYTSQDKRSVENRIGVVREFFPKGTDLRNVSDHQIQTVERHLNNRPVRNFGYLSPVQQTLKYRAVAFIT